jgi:hypothetical protein
MDHMATQYKAYDVDHYKHVSLNLALPLFRNNGTGGTSQDELHISEQ